MQQITQQVSGTNALPHDLWQKLQGFQIDSPNTQFTFIRRLARENNWSLPYAKRVFAEYKKFLCLTVIADHPVTPSDEVDQAWHLHLTYTRSYWNELCEGILGQPLHHNPTLGGREEDEKYNGYYFKTLVSYERTFGHQPPADIWPAPAERFAPDKKYVRMNPGNYWMIRKPALTIRKTAVFIAAATLSSVTLAACSADETGLVMVVGGAVFGFSLLAGWISSLFGNRRNQPRIKDGTSAGSISSCGSGCSSLDSGIIDSGSSDSSGSDSGSADGGASDGGSSSCSSGGCSGGGCGGGGCS